MDKATFHLNAFLAVGYGLTLVWIAFLYQFTPHPIWALPMGCACFMGARKTQACFAYLRAKPE